MKFSELHLFGGKKIQDFFPCYHNFNCSIKSKSFLAWRSVLATSLGVASRYAIDKKQVLAWRSVSLRHRYKTSLETCFLRKAEAFFLSWRSLETTPSIGRRIQHGCRHEVVAFATDAENKHYAVGVKIH